MIKLFKILAILLVVVETYAQAPEKMSYQAVIRDTNNDLISNQSIGMEISILQGTTSGTVVYTETHTAITNTNGLVSVEIGTGTSSDDFSTIDWANGPYFIKTESDITGGEDYTITSTSQLLSVPYALHAKTAECITNNVYDFYLGQDTLGGIVFYISLDQNGIQHGLIVSKTETTLTWQNTIVFVDATRTEDGSYNTEQMADSPAKDWVTGLGDGWYLPSIDELSILWHSRGVVNKTAREIGSTLLSSTEVYWSSTERNAARALAFIFDYGYSGDYGDKT
ncbi:MAG: hypothetical protein PHW82_12755 [Bacteroidales bacterium]|nr:hypothetical protein [Bacteroidales bacterium]